MFVVVCVVVLLLIREMCFLSKKAGLMPTGIRTHEAKRKGYQSVADMLIVEKPQKKENGDSKGGNGQERVASDKVWCCY